MKVIKRNGSIVDYDREKIVSAISKANNEVRENERASPHRSMVACFLLLILQQRGAAVIHLLFDGTDLSGVAVVFVDIHGEAVSHLFAQQLFAQRGFLADYILKRITP